MKKIKFDHVGRPSNKEINEYKKKRNLKIIAVIIACMLMVGVIFIYTNKENIFLESLMGNSTYSSTMKKVQNSNKYKKITFTPEKYKDGYYYQTKKQNSSKSFVASIFEETGYYGGRYSWEKIQVFSEGNYIKTIKPDAKYLKLKEMYVGKTLGLKVFVQSNVSKRKYALYLRLFVTDGGLNKSVIDEEIDKDDNITNECVADSDSFYWPIGPDKKGKPLTTNISSGYSNRKLNGNSGMHYGIDISKGNKPSIIAVYDGKVTKVVNYSKNTYKAKRANYGTYVILEHNYKGEKLYSIYAHMKYKSIPSNIYVGAKVKKGTKLGIMGNTGYSSGTHLHFEMRKNDTKVETREKNNVNPLDYINPNKPYPSGSSKCN